MPEMSPLSKETVPLFAEMVSEVVDDKVDVSTILD